MGHTGQGGATKLFDSENDTAVEKGVTRMQHSKQDYSDWKRRLGLLKTLPKHHSVILLVAPTPVVRFYLVSVLLSSLHIKHVVKQTINFAFTYFKMYKM